MKNLKILLTFLLVFTMFTGVSDTTGGENVSYVSRIVVLSEISDFYNAQNLQNQTIKSQSGLISILEELAQTGDVIDYQPFWIQNWVSVTCKTTALDSIYNADGVESIMPNVRVYADKMTSSKKLASSNDTWNLEMVGAPEIWEQGITGEGAVIGVLDSGCDSTHPELAGKILQYGYIDGYGRKTSQKVATDADGHGTSVCSVIAGETTGVAPDAKLIVGAVIPGGSGSMTQILGGMQWILNPDGDYKTDDAPKVVNMSFGAPGALKYLESGIRNMVKMGILPVASAGNDGEGSTSNPGNFPDVIAVGAVDFTETVADFSGGADVLWEDIDTVETVTKPDISAPGESIRVATPHRTYDLADGTSSAAPHVAGLCALMLSKNPEMAPEDLRYALLENSKDLGKPGKDRRYGVGLAQGEESFNSTLGREPRKLNIIWREGNLWGDIEVKTSDRTYTVSRDKAEDFTFLAEPGTDVLVSSFGFEDTYTDGEEVILAALPAYTLDLTAFSPDLNAVSPCKVRLPETPLPTYEGPDGHVEVALPIGKHKLRIYAFGHSDEEIEVEISEDTELSVDLVSAKIAFIDDRKSVFGIPPEPIQGKMRRSLDPSGIPYFIWSTRDGRVTASQLSRFDYVIWNLGGSPSDKIIKVLKGYMDLGGKLILTSDFYGASYLGESDSTVFLASYFDCYPTDGGGSAIKHWDGESWNTVAIETPSFLRSTELVPLGDKAKPIFYYSGFEKKTIAGIKVSSVHSQGVILGFTIPEINSDEKRTWLLEYLFDSFEDTTSFTAQVEGDGVGLDGVVIIGDEQVEFAGGELFIPHIPNNGVMARVISYGYDEKIIHLEPTSLGELIELEKSEIGMLNIDANTDGYIIFHDVPIDPVYVSKNQSLELPHGNYDVSFVSKSFIPQKLKIEVPGELNVNLVNSPGFILLPDGYTQIANLLSSLGLAHASKADVTASDIVSSSVFIWSSSGKIKQNDRDLTAEIKTALKCGASVIIAGPELVKSFGGPVEIESIASKIFAVIGRSRLDGMLISINKATKRYGMTIPVLSGDKTLASFVGGQSAIVKYDNLIVSGFEFEKIDLDVVKKETLRLLLLEFGVDDSKLPTPKITTPASPTNMKPLTITGFVAPGSESVIVFDDAEYELKPDMEGFFSFASTLPEGSYKVQLKSKKDGKKSESVKTPLVIDWTPPEVIVLSPKNGFAISHEVEVIASCVGAKKVTIDGVEAKVSNGQISKKVSTGNGVIMLEAVDASGNKNTMMLNYKPSSNTATDASLSGAYFEISQTIAANIFGDIDVEYRPFQVATKGEVAVYLTKALGLEPKPGKCPYNDVSKTDQIEPYLGALYDAKVLSGIGEFNQNGNSSMEFLLQMIANRYGFSHIPSAQTFSDLDKNSPWYGGVEGCVKAKILNPKDKRLFDGKSFNPGSGAKREKVAIILYWLLKYRARNGGA